MIEILGKLNKFISNFDSIIGVLGLILTVIGSVELSEAYKIKIRIKKLEQFIINADKIESSQVAQTINNNGLGYNDTKEVASEVVKQATKNKPDFYMSEEEPKDAAPGSIWFNTINKED